MISTRIPTTHDLLLLIYRLFLVAVNYVFWDVSDGFKLIGVPIFKSLMVLILAWNFMGRLPFYYTRILRLYGFSLWFLSIIPITLAVKGIVYEINGYILDTAVILLLSKALS